MVRRNPGLLESRALALDMGLRFSRVPAESACWRWCNAPLVKHCIEWERTSYGLHSTCFFAVEICISPSILPSVLPGLPCSGRSIQAAVRESVGMTASAPARPRFSCRMLLRLGSAAVCTRSSRSYVSHSAHACFHMKWTASGSISMATGLAGSDSAAADSHMVFCAGQL